MRSEKEIREMLEILRKNREYAARLGFHHQVDAYKQMEAVLKWVLGMRDSPDIHDFEVHI